VGVLRGHKGAVVAVTYSTDGATLASAGDDRTVRLWDLTASEPKVKQILKGHEGTISSLALAADGKALASGDRGGTTLLWDLRDGQARLRAKLPPALVDSDYKKYQAVAFSPDGTVLATGNLCNVVLWDLKRRDPVIVRTLKPSQRKNVVQSLAFSPDGKILAVGHYDAGGTLLWDLQGDLKQEAACLDSGTTRTVAFSPDGKLLASAPSGKVWAVSGATAKLAGELSGKLNGFPSAAFSPDGKTLVSGGDVCTVRLWDVTGAEPRAKLPVKGHDDEVRAVVISPDGRTLASSSYDGTLRLWDLGGPQPKPRATFSADSEYAVSLAFTPDGKKLISGNWNRTLRVWDVSERQPRLLKKLGEYKFLRDEIWGLAISPDGKTAASSGRRHSLRLWDLTPEGSRDSIAPKGPARYHGTLAHSPDGKTVASGSTDNGTLRLWNVADPKLPREQFVLNAHQQAQSRNGVVHAVAFAPDGGIVVSGGDDGVVRFWNLSGETPKEQATLGHAKGPVNSVHFSPEGSKLAVAYGGGYVFLGDSTGRKLRDWQLDGPSTVRFAPDGKHLLVANSNATAYILRLND
jgi:WD40 repeat protein